MADETIAGAAGADAAADTGAAAQAATGAAATIADAGNATGDQGADGQAGAADAAAIKPDFPDDWREKLAGKDEKLLGELKRYKTVKSWSDAGHAARQRIRSGEVKASVPFPTDGDDAAKAAWRAENGLPAEAKGYIENLDGLVIGETDKPVIEAFAERMHGLNAPPGVVKDVVAWYYDRVGQQAAEEHQRDEEFRVNTLVAIKGEMGPAFQGNMKALNSFLTQGVLDTDGNVAVAAPEGLQGLLLTARAADGTPLGNHPDVLRYLSAVGTYLNPSATLAPASGGATGAATVADEIKSIEALMSDRKSAYYKDEKMQARYRDLVDARDRNAKKTAA